MPATTRTPRTWTETPNPAGRAWASADGARVRMTQLFGREWMVTGYEPGDVQSWYREEPYGRAEAMRSVRWLQRRMRFPVA